MVIVISRFLKRYFKAKRTSATAYSRAVRRIKGGFSKGWVKRSSGPISRIPGYAHTAKSRAWRSYICKDYGSLY